MKIILQEINTYLNWITHLMGNEQLFTSFYNSHLFLYIYHQTREAQFESSSIKIPYEDMNAFIIMSIIQYIFPFVSNN